MKLRQSPRDRSRRALRGKYFAGAEPMKFEEDPSASNLIYRKAGRELPAIVDYA